MNIEFRLLNDILAKAITAKAGSFDAVTHCGIKINWSKLLFDILKEMVTPSSKQTREFAVKLSLLLEEVPGLTLGEPKALPPLKILTVKSIGTYIAKNKSMLTTSKMKEK
ncbi:hydrolase, hydrolyzing O-glycosyl compound [Dorcoceras hygrometricum]|uniref:Hydrolase, hydrolyzing O-glycosyl compound n=1 Tax=Dorcoceras hygrometricum TaxID=472368 RepID=A0A2Z7CKF1_9LAMI|nr:hydrolase, hydrolyzing O-glycosyl compound [Dorcoceras hygrometricum]